MPNVASAHKAGEDGKISIARCWEILNRNGLNYTDEEICKIRDFLYSLVEIVREEGMEQQQNPTIIPLEQHKITDHAKSNHLRAG
jgi:hypothetical protein